MTCPRSARLKLLQRSIASRHSPPRAATIIAGHLVAVLVLVGAIFTDGARASTLPTTFSAGLVDYPSFQSSASTVRSLWLGRAQQIGSAAVRLTAEWSQIAPSRYPRGFHAANPADPHYNFSTLDAAVSTAVADGQTVLLMVFHAPRWAEAPDRPRYVAPGAWDPRPRALAAFAHALASRYSGRFPDPQDPIRMLPRVGQFQAWNEPNLPLYLMPQWVRGRHGSILASSATIYRSLLNAFYGAVKQVQPRAFVLAAGTAPYGDPPGVDRMKPLVFLRGLFCLTSALRAQACPDPPHFDALDHHPYSRTPSVHAYPDNVSVPDLGRILRLLRAAQRVGHVLPAGHKQLWITEIGFSSRPPDAATFSRQARYLALAFYEFWRQGVAHVFWFQLRDPTGPTNVFSDGGLYLRSGVAKPSATAFRFPFVALPAPHGRLILWGRSPVPGQVVIEARVRDGWRRILALATTRGGVFYVRRVLSSHLRLRAQAGVSSSLAWSPG